LPFTLFPYTTLFRSLFFQHPLDRSSVASDTLRQHYELFPFHRRLLTYTLFDKLGRLQALFFLLMEVEARRFLDFQKIHRLLVFLPSPSKDFESPVQSMEKAEKQA